MQRKWSSFLLPIALLAVVGTAVWGYGQYQQKNAILVKRENQYQRAFHSLAYQLDQVHGQIGNALAISAGSNQFQRKCLVNIWRMTSEAQNEVNQLPLSLVPFHETEQFLSKISNFSYQTALRDLEKEPLNEDELATLRSLYTYSKQISKQVSNVQSEVLRENLRWSDVELALASGEQADNSIIDGFKVANKQVDEYEDIKWGPSTTTAFQEKSYRMLTGKAASVEEVKKKAQRLVKLRLGDQLDIVENGKGTPYQSYGVTIQKAESRGESENEMIHMDYTKNGGHLIWFMYPRSIAKKQISVDQAIDEATRFLKQHDYGTMKAVNYEETDKVANITLATIRDDVVIYPKKLNVRVAMDNGEVIGLQAGEFMFEQSERSWSPPKITVQEARKELHADFEVRDSGLAIISNDAKKEVLCYEFLGGINGNLYRIFVNADTGMEESIEQLKNS